MIVKVKISTPKGEAAKVAKKLQWFVLGTAKPLPTKSITNLILNKLKALHNGTTLEMHETIITDKEESFFIWVIEADARRYVKVIRNVTLFDKMITGVLDNKLLKKMVRKKLSGTEAQQLETMLLNHTRVEVLKD